MNLTKDIHERALLWSSSDIFDRETRQEIQELLDVRNEKEIINRFYKDLEFGTGGMRGVMGAGLSRFNIYNVRRATQALALYLKKLEPKKKLTIAVAYDSRMNSRFYAEAVCEILASHKIHSLITRQMRPVPMLSFMVRHFHCDAGVCITASHNPAEYNGYKIYWKSGGQLTPPHDGNILEFYKQLSDYAKLPSYSFQTAIKESFTKEVLEELDNPYFEKLNTLSLFKGGRDLKIVYTPLHGTGIYAVPRALKNFGFHNVKLVEEQSEPDGKFPTVESPNPEDPRSLTLAQKLAVSLNADVVFATDPDADRLAVVVREEDTWKMFSGNQMGALLFNYVLSLSKKENKTPTNGFTIKTTVTSKLIEDVSNYYGFPCEETLTGFKWICDLIEAYESGKIKPYKSFICGAEESYGFLAGSFVRDKDAILSCVVACEMLAYYKSLNKTLSSVLDELYMRHGYYFDCLETLTLPGKDGEEKIRNIMQNLRNKSPRKIGDYVVLNVKDYLYSGFDSKQKLPSSDVLLFECQDAKITVRPSGTEPKIKIYVSVYSSTQNITSLFEVKKKSESKMQNLLKAVSQWTQI